MRLPASWPGVLSLLLAEAKTLANNKPPPPPSSDLHDNHAVRPSQIRRHGQTVKPLSPYLVLGLQSPSPGLRHPSLHPGSWSGAANLLHTPALASIFCTPPRLLQIF